MYFLFNMADALKRLDLKRSSEINGKQLIDLEVCRDQTQSRQNCYDNRCIIFHGSRYCSYLGYPIVQLIALGLIADPSRFGRVLFLKRRGARIVMLVGGRK